MEKRVKMKMHCIGDSHTGFFTGYDRIQPEYPATSESILDYVVTYRLGSPLAYNLCETDTKSRGREKLFEILGALEPRKDFILLSFGEVDCRAHLIRQAEINSKGIEEIVGKCIERYLGVILEIKRAGFEVGVWNAVPTAMGFENELFEYPYYGTYADRNRTTFLFNERLKKCAEANGFGFYSVFEKIIEKDWTTDTRYYFDKIHLNSKLLPYVLSQIKKLNINIGITNLDILKVLIVYKINTSNRKISFSRIIPIRKFKAVIRHLINIR